MKSWFSFSPVAPLFLFALLLTSLSYAQPDPSLRERLRDFKVHRAGKIWVGVSNFGQIGIDAGGRGVIWPGTSAPGREGQYINRGGFYFGGIVPSDATNGPDLHASGDLDTLVSEGHAAWSVVDFNEMFAHHPDARSAIQERSTLPESDFFTPDAVSGEDFVAAYTDTFLSERAQGLGFTFVPFKHQRALGLEIIEKSYQFGEPFAEDIVFFDLIIRNIGTNHIRNFYAGIFIDNDMGCIGDFFNDQEDATGFMVVNSAGDTVNTAWVVDTNGAGGCLAGAVGVRILRPTAREAKLSYNWWMADIDIDSKEDWGPVTPNVYTGDSNQNDPIGSPVNDPQKYLLMRNGSIDWPQYDRENKQFDPRIPLVPGPLGFRGVNDPSRFLLSIGPIGARDSTITDPNDPMFGQTVKIFAPGDSILFTLAIIGGEGDPLFSQQIKSFDPAAFTDLGRNAVIAASLFDTPRVDTDGDGFAGDDLDGDGVIDNGDGVPDFKPPVPPPSPPLNVIPGDRSVTLDWSAADPNQPEYDANDLSLPLNFIDPFFSDDPATPEDERKDFEGFRVLKSKIGEQGTFELLAEFDVPDNEFGRNTGLSFRYVDHVPNGAVFYYAVVSFDRGDQDVGIESRVSEPLANLTKAMASPLPVNAIAERKVWVEPNPYIEGTGFENFVKTDAGITINRRAIDFVNVPAVCTIRIFTPDGDLVRTLLHESANASRARWDLLSRTGREIASGLYVFAVETADGTRQEGRFLVIK